VNWQAGEYLVALEVSTADLGGGSPRLGP